jgi:hydrogenase expression/formation protein HypD
MANLNYIDEFREKEKTEGILRRIREVSKKDASIMEICGTHTHSVSKYGIRDALPPNIRLISGPGCPVCVTSAGDINRIIEFSKRERNVIIATFGDMMRVPGTVSTLTQTRAGGADIRVVYSPLGAIDIAKAEPSKEVVFYAVGFETTAPTVAGTILKAKNDGVKNLSVLSLHKLTPPAMKALIDGGEIDITGFICPGHVTAVIGANAYGFIARDYKSPCVVAGFEPLDVLLGLLMLTKQIEEGRSDIEIEYDRVVTPGGNITAQEVMNEVFAATDARWRGIGTIPASGLKIRPAYAEFDAEKKFAMPLPEEDAEPKGCSCGKVLKGLITPPECVLFGQSCTPDTPAGPCMVSSEGTCAAFYKYRRG